MYLIILLSVTLWRLFGGCYLFAVETPQGSIQQIRDCCSVNSPLTSSGWAWLLFQWVSFVLAWSSNLRVTVSPWGGLMALPYAPQHTGWSLWSCQSLKGVSMPSEAEGKRENKMLGTKLEKRCCLKFWKVRMIMWMSPYTGCNLWEWNYLMIQWCFPSMSITILVFNHVANLFSQHKLYSVYLTLCLSVNSLKSDIRLLH